MRSIRIGTRGSKLALWQARWVADGLQRLGWGCELTIISTSGDISTASLGQVGGQGLFTKEIQRELLQGKVDVAVHSLKDLPTMSIPELVLAAVPTRETTSDCLISTGGLLFEQLPTGARVGTGSSRRAAQLRAWRPDITIADIRGNVDSRLRKLDEGHYDAIVLAAAGLSRLELIHRVTETLPQDKMLPAIGQGALGLECRANDTRTREVLSQLNDATSYGAVVAERELLRGLGAGCLAPVAGLAMMHNGQLLLHGRVLDIHGHRQLNECASGPLHEAATIGKRLSQRLLERGAGELIALARETA
ncbi:MAG: hydroxymethylbilane synthase [Pirellulaceae bacterium]|nr:hydroxymethylbilane synthase [Pirellulaceae bacterium]